MEENNNINMSNESSAHNDLNNIVLKKKRLDIVDEEINNLDNNPSKINYQLEEIIEQKQDNNEKQNTIKKEEFKQSDPNYHSGIIETHPTKKKTKPSVLIILIIIIAVFFGEVIYNFIIKKKPSDELNNDNIVEKNNTSENEVNE